MSNGSAQRSYSSQASLLTRAMSAPLLSRDEEYDLFERWRNDGDQSALNHIIKCHLRLVASIATRFKGFGLAQAELFQQGVIGLMQAAEKFDLDRGVRFSTYASWWVRSEMRDQVMRNWSLVRTGTTVAQKRLFFRLRHAVADRGSAEGDSLPPDVAADIAETLDVRVSDVVEMHGRLKSHDVSLNAPLTENSDGEWIEQLEDDGETPEELVGDRMRRQQARELIAEAMECLSGREYFIIQERRLSEAPATLAKLGVALGISKERVRQLERDAMQKMAAFIAKELGRPGGRIPLPF